MGVFFRDENVRLRDTGHKLSELRDAGTLIGTLDNLRHQHDGAVPRKLLSHRLFDLEKRQLEEQAAARKLLPGLAVELRKARRSIRYWPLETDGFQAIAAGVEQTFRAGRKAMAVASRSGRIEDFHEWRKRVKDHWYQVRLLNRVWTDVMSGYQQSLTELEDALGEDINLSLLEPRFSSWRRKMVQACPCLPFTKRSDQPGKICAIKRSKSAPKSTPKSLGNSPVNSGDSGRLSKRGRPEVGPRSRLLLRLRRRAVIVGASHFCRVTLERETGLEPATSSLGNWVDV